MAAMAPSMTVPVAKIAALSGPVGSQFVQQTSSTLRLSSVCRIGSKPRELASELRSWQKRKVCRSRCRGLAVRAADELASVTGAGGDSVVSEVAVLEEEPETPGVASPAVVKERKPGPLQKGGTMSGKEALGKDPSAATLGKKKGDASEAAAFEDPRWVKGTWDFTKFTKDGKVHWDSVIDAEVKRRKWLEDNPEASSNSDPVVFETSQIPWWAWVRRFHLPEAELLNGRAAMVGYFAAYLVDSATGVGLVDQQSSFLGKLLLFITVVGILLIRKGEDLDTLKTLAKESTFYDKQWQATWKEDSTKEEKPSE